MVLARVGGGAALVCATAEVVAGRTAGVVVRAGAGCVLRRWDVAGWRDVAIGASTGAMLGASLADGKAGRDVTLGVGVGLVCSLVGLLAARPIPITTTAHPATATEAAHEDTSRPQRMWPVCQL